MCFVRIVLPSWLFLLPSNCWRDLVNRFACRPCNLRCTRREVEPHPLLGIAVGLEKFFLTVAFACFSPVRWFFLLFIWFYFCTCVGG